MCVLQLADPSGETKLAPVPTSDTDPGLMSPSQPTQESHSLSLPPDTDPPDPNPLQQASSVFLDQQGLGEAGEALGAGQVERMGEEEGQEFTVVVNRDGVHQLVPHIGSVAGGGQATTQATSPLSQPFPHTESPTL